MLGQASQVTTVHYASYALPGWVLPAVLIGAASIVLFGWLLFAGRGD